MLNKSASRPVLPSEKRSSGCRRPLKRVDRRIEMFGQIDLLPRSAIVKHQPPAIRLVPRNELRAISDPFSVGRINRPPIVARIVRDLLRRALAIRRYGENIVRSCSSPHPYQLFAVNAISWLSGENADRLRVAEIERRHIVIRARRQIARRTCERPSRGALGCRARRRNNKQMAALAVPPLRPVAIEKLRVYPRLHFALLLSQRRASRCTHRPRNRDTRSKRTQWSFHPATTISLSAPSGKGSQPRRFAARERNPIDLRACRRGAERNAIFRPSGDHRGRSSLPSARQLPRLAAVRRHQPKYRSPARFASLSGVATV